MTAAGDEVKSVEAVFFTDEGRGSVKINKSEPKVELVVNNIIFV